MNETIAAQAMELLSILACQPTWEFGVWSVPGFTIAARLLATRALVQPEPRGWCVDDEERQLCYAAAEGLLREGWR
jgi:hypothetical protein